MSLENSAFFFAALLKVGRMLVISDISFVTKLNEGSSCLIAANDVAIVLNDGIKRIVETASKDIIGIIEIIDLSI